LRIRFHDQSPCAQYSIEDYGFFVVVNFPGGGDRFAQGDDADIIRREWDDCAAVGDFSYFEEIEIAAFAAREEEPDTEN